MPSTDLRMPSRSYLRWQNETPRDCDALQAASVWHSAAWNSQSLQARNALIQAAILLSLAVLAPKPVVLQRVNCVGCLHCGRPFVTASCRLAVCCRLVTGAAALLALAQSSQQSVGRANVVTLRPRSLSVLVPLAPNNVCRLARCGAEPGDALISAPSLHWRTCAFIA